MINGRVSKIQYVYNGFLGVSEKKKHCCAFTSPLFLMLGCRQKNDEEIKKEVTEVKMTQNS